MRSQILTQKRSAQSEQSKFAILTNELRRRFSMMDEGIEINEKLEKIDHFSQQLINSGYSWRQIREVVVSGMKGVVKEEARRREGGFKKYRTSAESLQSRIKKKLTENTQWYKRQRENGEDIRVGKEEGEEKVRSWKEWRRKKPISNRNPKIPKVERDDKLEGILFIPHTEKSELSKRIRSKLEMLEKLSSLSIRVVERTGEKLEDILHKSNPWEGEHCGRKGCNFCDSGDSKLVGKCKLRNLVYENECLLCKGGIEKQKGVATNNKDEEETIECSENKRNKRKREFIEKERGRNVNECQSDKRESQVYKYIGETSRSGYERCEEHWKDFTNLSNKSHILKHYVDKHMNSKKLGEVRFQMKVIQRYRSAFERQIGESIHINSNLRRGVNILNSKNEYNRCSIPRLGISNESKEELVERYEEEKEERELDERIGKLVSKLRMNKGEKQPAEKRRRVDKTVIETENEKEVLSQKEVASEKVSIISEIEKKKVLNKTRILKKIKERNEATKNLNYCDIKRLERKKEGWRILRERWLTSDSERNSFWAAAIELLPVREQKLSPVRSDMVERVNTTQHSLITAAGVRSDMVERVNTTQHSLITAAVVNSNNEADLMCSNQGENELKQLKVRDITEKVANITEKITDRNITDITDKTVTNEALTCSNISVVDKSKVITDSSTVEDLSNVIGSGTNCYPRRLIVPMSLDRTVMEGHEISDISATRVPEISATRVPETVYMQKNIYLNDEKSSGEVDLFSTSSTSSARVQDVYDVLSTGAHGWQDPYLFPETGHAGQASSPEKYIRNGQVLNLRSESKTNNRTDELTCNIDSTKNLGFSASEHLWRSQSSKNLDLRLPPLETGHKDKLDMDSAGTIKSRLLNRLGLKENAVKVENVIASENIDAKEAIEQKYLQSDLFNVTLKLRNNVDRQRHLSAEHLESQTKTSASTNEIAGIDNNIDGRIAELPNSDQADTVHQPQLNVSKPPDIFEATMKNENERCLPPPKAKLKSRGRGRARGGSWKENSKN